MPAPVAPCELQQLTTCESLSHHDGLGVASNGRSVHGREAAGPPEVDVCAAGEQGGDAGGMAAAPAGQPEGRVWYVGDERVSVV